MVKFYAVGLNRINNWKLIDRPNNYLLSANHCWANGFKTFRMQPSYMKDRSVIDDLFLDSGAYSLIEKMKKFPYTPDQLVEFAINAKVDCLASMDYPCSGPDHKMPNLAHLNNTQRIGLTVEKARKMKDLLETKNSEIKFYPVLQGYYLNEYAFCAELFKTSGLGSDYLAIGSVCIRKNLNDIKKILTLAKNEFPKAKIHVFGLTLKALRFPSVIYAIDSFDSLAWSFKTKQGHMYLWDPYEKKLRTVGLARIDLAKRAVNSLDSAGNITKETKTVVEKIEHHHISTQSAYLFSLDAYKQEIAKCYQKYRLWKPINTFLENLKQ